VVTAPYRHPAGTTRGDAAPPQRVYIVLGDPDGHVDVWSDVSLAVSQHHVLVAANLDADIVPVPRHRWDESAREALLTVLRRESPRAQLREHHLDDAPVGPDHPFYVTFATDQQEQS